MTTINYFSRLGFVGADADLSISLFEYSMVFRQIKKSHAKHKRNPNNYPVGEWEIVIPCLAKKNHFYFVWFKKDLDIKKEFNWIKEGDWNSFLRYLGIATFEEWNSFDLPQKLSDLSMYFGQENVFGNDYGNGFPVKYIS